MTIRFIWSHFQGAHLRMGGGGGCWDRLTAQTSDTVLKTVLKQAVKAIKKSLSCLKSGIFSFI